MITLGRIAKEPLVHFLIIGAVLFAVYAAVDDSPPPEDPDRIEISDAEVEGLASSFNRTWRRQPNDTELAAMIDDRVREEVFVREALALGLDQNDAVIRRRLRQKMEFLAQSMIGGVEPDAAIVEKYFEENRDKFRRPGRIAFRQVFLGENPDQDAVTEALSSLRAGADPATVGVRSLIPPELPLSPQTAVDGTLGRGFFQSLTEIPDDQWAGPVRSGYGVHLVLVTERKPAAVPPLDEIRDSVVQTWRSETQKELLDDRYRRMRERYEITLPATADAGSAAQ